MFHENVYGQLDALGEQARARVSKLEGNERKTLDWLAEGYSLREIARQLGVSLDDAANLKHSMMLKFHAPTTADLVRMALYARSVEAY